MKDKFSSQRVMEMFDEQRRAVIRGSFASKVEWSEETRFPSTTRQFLLIKAAGRVFKREFPKSSPLHERTTFAKSVRLFYSGREHGVTR